MNKSISQLVWTITGKNENGCVSINEDFTSCKYVFVVDSLCAALPDNIDIEWLPQRDILSIEFMDGPQSDATTDFAYRSDVPEGWTNFRNKFCNLEKTEKQRFEIKLTKKKCDGRISLYEVDNFINYVQDQPIDVVLGLWEKYIGKTKLMLEVQEDVQTPFTTSLVAFGDNKLFPLYKSINSINNCPWQKAKSFCWSELLIKELSPDVFYINKDLKSTPLYAHFTSLVYMLSITYLFDYTRLIDGNYEYKINGYRTEAGNFTAVNFKKHNLDEGLVELYYNIYRWVYDEGNTYDKVTIARNIISLNLENPNTLELRKGTFEAILSNFKIYGKQNVQRYIEVRNDISERLRQYQKDIIKTTDELDGDIKKLVFSFLTFVFTTVVIRVIAKNTAEEILVPDIIAYLLLGYCGVSYFYVRYAKWLKDKKITWLDENYTKMRKMYNDILSESELVDLFDDKSKADGTYYAFQEERKSRLQNLWTLILCILVFILIFILIHNNYNPIKDLINVISDLTTALCCRCGCNAG